MGEAEKQIPPLRCGMTVPTRFVGEVNKCSNCIVRGVSSKNLLDSGMTYRIQGLRNRMGPEE